VCDPLPPVRSHSMPNSEPTRDTILRLLGRPALAGGGGPPSTIETKTIETTDNDCSSVILGPTGLAPR